MSRPQGVQDGGSAGNAGSSGTQAPEKRPADRIDATVCAHAGSTIQRDFALSDLPRMREAGAREGTVVTVTAKFLRYEGRVATDGGLKGVAVLTCQRCMNELRLPLQEDFKVVLVEDEAELDQEPGGYEAVLADPVRFDLHALVEDQALLALPLIPKHDSDCAPSALDQSEPDAGIGSGDQGTQRPFGNLRDLMRKK